jgi:hypothetical protein
LLLLLLLILLLLLLSSRQKKAGSAGEKSGRGPQSAARRRPGAAGSEYFVVALCAPQNRKLWYQREKGMSPTWSRCRSTIRVFGIRQRYSVFDRGIQFLWLPSKEGPCNQKKRTQACNHGHCKNSLHHSFLMSSPRGFAIEVLTR